MAGAIVLLIILVLIIILLASCIKIVPAGSGICCGKAGCLPGDLECGPEIKMPFIDKIARKGEPEGQVVDFAPQPVITKGQRYHADRCVVFFQITDPKLYTYGVENPIMAIENLTATTLRNIIGDLELDQTLTSRETINTKMRASLDVATDPWGIKVTRVELKNIIPPAAIQDAMEKADEGRT